MKTQPIQKMFTLQDLQRVLQDHSLGAGCGCEDVLVAMQTDQRAGRVYQPENHPGHSGHDGAVARACRELWESLIFCAQRVDKLDEERVDAITATAS